MFITIYCIISVSIILALRFRGYLRDPEKGYLKKAMLFTVPLAPLMPLIIILGVSYDYLNERGYMDGFNNFLEQIWAGIVEDV